MATRPKLKEHKVVRDVPSSSFFTHEMRKGHVFPYSHFIVPYRQNVTVAIFMFLEVTAFLGNRFSSKTSEWASGRITMRIRVENGISKVASLTASNLFL